MGKRHLLTSYFINIGQVPYRCPVPLCTTRYFDINRASRLAEILYEHDKDACDAFCPLTDRGVVFYPDNIGDFDLIYLADSNAVAKSIKIAAMPRRSSDRFKKGIIKIIGSDPILRVNG